MATTETIPGKTIKEYKGLAWGGTVRSKHLGHDFLAALKSLAGGEIKSYKKLLNEGRTEAVKSLVENAKGMGADAVVGARFGSTQVLSATIEVYAYGTAVTLKK